jgi:NodT family efflux transporter outer membrane factor (OMF) lipoprotein
MKPLAPLRWRLAGALLATLAGAGCSLAPTYQRPEAATPPAAYQEPLPAGWKLAEPAELQAKGDWWQAFGDPTLDALQARVVLDNQNLQAAVARYDQARAAAGLARAAAVPLVNLGASATRSRTSENATRHLNGSPVAGDFSLGLNLSYEVDAWGRVRNAVQAGDARLQASAADLAALRLSTRAELAADYFALRGLERTQRVLAQTLDAYQQTFDLAQRRFAGGLVTELDVNQARVQLENTRTALTDVQLKARQLTHAIALLSGASASGFAVPAGALPETLPTVPVAPPSTLLERRPDVAAAERRVQAANADVGVARAGYFPTFSLGAAAGFDSAHTGSWFNAPSRFWSIGPQALLNLVDGGRQDSTVNAARAALDEAAARYRQTVLQASQEAEDSLAAIRLLTDESTSQQAAEQAAQRAFEQARRQYEGGLVTYLPVASAQAALAQAQQAGITLQVAQLTARVQLIKALGGGWQASP